MLQNEQFDSDIMQCDVTRWDIFISDVEYFNKKESHKILPNRLYYEFK